MDRIDLHIEQGANATFTFTCKDIGGNILDLSDKLIRSEIKLSTSHKNAFKVPFIMVADAENGVLVWMLDAMDTQQMQCPEFDYDIVVSDQAVIHRVIQGKIFTDQGVTRL